MGANRDVGRRHTLEAKLEEVATNAPMDTLCWSIAFISGQKRELAAAKGWRVWVQGYAHPNRQKDIKSNDLDGVEKRQ